MDRLNLFKLFIDNHKKKIFLLFALLIVLFVSIYFILDKNNQEEEKIIFDNLETEVIDKKEDIENYYVDIKGCVNNEGVYMLPKGSRVIDQTTPNMIQRISRIFERNPLISKEI